MQRLVNSFRRRWYIVIRINNVVVEDFYANLNEEQGYPDTWSIESYIRRKYGVSKIISWIRGISRTIIFDLYF